jgi:predicted HTH domain antitoxin
MAIHIELPTDVEKELRRQDPQLDDHARDLVLVSNYQSGKLSTADIASILNLETRNEAEEWLARRGAFRNYSLEALESDRKALDRILGQVSK